MKISIDTKEDSKEDIKKLIKMLQSLIEDSSYSSPSISPSQSESLFNMFGDSETQSQQANGLEGQAAQTQVKEKDEGPAELPQLIPY